MSSDSEVWKQGSFETHSTFIYYLPLHQAKLTLVFKVYSFFFIPSTLKTLFLLTSIIALVPKCKNLSSYASLKSCKNLDHDTESVLSIIASKWIKQNITLICMIKHDNPKYLAFFCETSVCYPLCLICCF